MNLEERVAKLDDLILAIIRRRVGSFAYKNVDLTLKAIFVIEILSRRSSATMSELASALSVPLTTMTSTVTRMVRKGYLERSRIEEDRRVVIVTLSPKGRALFEQHWQSRIKAMTGLFSTLTEEEQDQLLALIAKVLTAISSQFTE